MIFSRRCWFYKLELLRGFEAISSRSKDAVIDPKQRLRCLDRSVRPSRTHDTCVTTARPSYTSQRTRFHRLALNSASAEVGTQVTYRVSVTYHVVVNLIRQRTPAVPTLIDVTYCSGC